MRTISAACFAGQLLLCMGCGMSHNHIDPPPPVCASSSVVSGTLVDANTGSVPPAATAVVYLEQLAGSNGGIASYNLTLGTIPNSSGAFQLCAPAGGSYAVVAAALDSHGMAYPIAIVTGVPPGTTLGNVSLGRLGGSPSALAALNGTVSTSTGTTATPATVNVYVQHSATDAVPFTYVLPMFQSSVSHLFTQTSQSCASATACGTYAVVVPSQSPTVRRLGDNFSVQAAAAPTYTLVSTASVGANSSQLNCNPSSLVTALQANGQPLTATPGAQLIAMDLSFSGCQ